MPVSCPRLSRPSGEAPGHPGRDRGRRLRVDDDTTDAAHGARDADWTGGAEWVLRPYFPTGPTDLPWCRLRTRGLTRASFSLGPLHRPTHTSHPDSRPEEGPAGGHRRR